MKLISCKDAAKKTVSREHPQKRQNKARQLFFITHHNEGVEKLRNYFPIRFGISCVADRTSVLPLRGHLLLVRRHSAAQLVLTVNKKERNSSHLKTTVSLVFVFFIGPSSRSVNFTFIDCFAYGKYEMRKVALIIPGPFICLAYNKMHSSLSVQLCHLSPVVC